MRELLDYETMLMAMPIIFLLAISAGAYSDKIPATIMLCYLIASTLSLLLYAKDKAAARASRRRTPERTLHIIALAGGWPGAMLAQQWLRHKTRKRSFRIIFWITVGVNISVAGYLLRDGEAFF